MGNSQSTFNTTVHKVVASDYQLLGKNASIRWGELFEMKNIKTNQMVFMQEKHARDLETHQKTIEQCTYHISLSHNNLSSVYGFAGGEAPDTFTNTYKVCVFFEHVVNSLSGIIRNRKAPLPSSNPKFTQRFTQSYQYFDESELLRFMNQLVEVFDFLQRNGINQGDITPDVCFISQEGIIKVLDRKLIYNDVSSFDQAEQGSTNVFLTPTELGALAEEKPKPSENRYKADVFRLGMTLLECATLQRSSDVYDWNNYVINLDVLSGRLIEVKERYTSAFYDPLREMLRFEEEKRPDFNILNRHFQEEAAQNLAANMAIPYQEEETEMRTSIFGMGPKLITNFPVRPGVNQSSPGQGSSVNVAVAVQDKKRNSLQQTSKEIFERKNHRGPMPKAKRDEDIDDTTEFDSDMKVNKIPFTEARNSVGSRGSRTPTESPAKRLQKMISERHGMQAEDKNISSESNAQNTASTPQNQRFSLSLRDFFKRGSPNKESTRLDASPNQNDTKQTAKGQKPPSPKMMFAENIPSSNRQHRRVASGSYQSNVILSKSSINPPQTRNHDDSIGSPSQAFDLRKKPPYNGAYHTRSPTAQLPSKEYFSSFMNRQQPSANVTPRQHDENVTASDYYFSVPSNPPTQRAPGQRPSYRVANAAEFVAGDNGDVSMPNESMAVLDEQRPYKATPRTGHDDMKSSMLSVASQSVRGETSKKEPFGEQEAKPDEQDLVEAILRKVLNSAGISPKKQPRPLQAETKLPFEYAKPQGLIRPVKVEMNENIIREGGRGPISPYDENLKKSYTIDSANRKSRLQEARDERKAFVRPLEDQLTQAVEPKPITSPKFGFRGASVDPKPIMGLGERRSFYDDIKSTKGSVIIDKTKAFRGETVVNWEAGSPLVKKPIIQSYLDDPTGLKVEDRFEKAMERSRRSKGYMRDLADKMNKAGSRTTSVEPTARSTHGGEGMLFRSGLFLNNPSEIRMNS